MSQIIFRGAFLRFADMRINEGGVFSRLHFTSDLSDPVINAMGWEPIPDCINSTKLRGELVGMNLVLLPNGENLRNEAVEMECSSVEDFQVHRVEQKNHTLKTELRFMVLVRQLGAAGLVENYLRIVGQKPAQLKIGYAEQQELPLGESPHMELQGEGL